MRKSVRIKLESTNWNKLKVKSLEHGVTVEKEANVMLKEYVDEKC